MNSETNDQLVVMALGKDNNTYKSDMQVCYRFHVTPGEYCCVPSTIEEGVEKEFMLRVFTSGPVCDIKKVQPEVIIHELTDNPGPDYCEYLYRQYYI